jgi:hypothetical protein
MAVYLNHPFYEGRKPEDMTPFQESLPVIGAGILWALLVCVIVLLAVAYGRRHGPLVGDLRDVKIATWVCFALSVAIAAALPGAAGAVICTFINACLLMMCLVYVGIGLGLGVTIGADALLCTCGIVMSIGVCWL